MDKMTTIEMLDHMLERIAIETRMDLCTGSKTTPSTHTDIAWDTLANYLSGDAQGHYGD